MLRKSRSSETSETAWVARLPSLLRAYNCWTISLDREIAISDMGIATKRTDRFRKKPVAFSDRTTARLIVRLQDLTHSGIFTRYAGRK